jgi:hypothetical protein
VGTAWPATRPTHSFFKFCAYPLNVLPSGFRPLDGDDPADPFIAREGRNILPFCSRRRVRNENFSQIRWYSVYRTTGDRALGHGFQSISNWRGTCPALSANRKLDALTSILKPTGCVRIGESASGYALPELLPISRAGLSAVDCSKCFSQLRSDLLRFRRRCCPSVAEALVERHGPHSTGCHPSTSARVHRGIEAAFRERDQN